MEADLLSDAPGLFIEAVTESMHHSLNQHLSCGGKGDTQNDVTLDTHLAGFTGVLHGRLGNDFEIGGFWSCSDGGGRCDGCGYGGNARGSNLAW
jgi:hypothetical protein